MDCSESFVIFRIHYETNFGENMYVTGNTPELGNWNLQKALKLQWISNHYWIGKLSLSSKQYPIEYKYILIKNNDCNDVKWEKGNNRLLNQANNSKPQIFLNDIWNHRKVKIKLRVEQDTRKKWMYIVGSLPQLGNFNQLKKMTLSRRNNCTQKSSYWVMNFYVRSDVTQFFYLYILKDKITTNYFFERREQRIANLFHVYRMNCIRCCSENEIKEKMHENNYQTYKQNKFVFCDSKFSNSQFSTSITGNLFLGNFPYFQSEIDKMLQNDVKAVLNINNFGEYSRKSINWEIITQKYSANNFEFIDFLLEENSANQLQYQLKINKAVDLLNDMIIKYKKVFLHCTLGNKITTEIALKYLCKYKHFSQDAAIKFLHYNQIPKDLTPTIKQRHRRRHPSKRRLQCSKEVSSRIMKILLQTSFQTA